MFLICSRNTYFPVRYTFCFILLFSIFSIKAQRTCATPIVNEFTEKNRNKVLFLFTPKNSGQRIKSSNVFGKTTEDGAIVIPVVIHNLHRNDSQILTKAQIDSQINVLNEDFRKLNNDFNQTPKVFQPLGADVEIEFQLAEYDPDGNATNGIIRKRVDFGIKLDISASRHFRSSQGGSDAWDPSQYLNIWVGEMDDGKLLGFATSPLNSGSFPAHDGAALNYKAFGTNGTAIFPFNRGRTTTHEIGHYFNLYHIWGTVDKSCTVSHDDGIADTPNQRTKTFSSSSLQFPDTNPTTNCPDTGPNGTMFMNYMDYVNDADMHLFTLDQKSAMQYALTNKRSGLLNSIGFTCLRNYYEDQDKDGLGNYKGNIISSCTPVPNHVLNNYDNDDNQFIDLKVIGIPVTNGEFEINSTAGIVTNIEIFNNQGKLLQVNKPNKVNPIIKLDNQTAGTYYLIIETELLTFDKQIIVK